MRTVTLPGGETVPALGLGTWRMGENRKAWADEIKALHYGLDLGMTLIDTAEMYGEGGAERVVGEILKTRRDEVFLVSKVYPHNATYDGVQDACARSLKRLATDRIDLYLLHWPGSTPIAETVEGFERLVEIGDVRHWGVSNFDTADMDGLWNTADGRNCATNQVLYNLARRGIEHDLLPWSQSHDLPVMAYSPLEQGRRLGSGALETIAKRHGATPLQIALAWCLRRKDIIAIPKAVRTEHLDENRAALDITLTTDDLNTLDAAFPPPDDKQPLAIL
ncbi:MAG: aldo/keto reductase [Pseudomonadota bacterium]